MTQGVWPIVKKIALILGILTAFFSIVATLLGIFYFIVDYRVNRTLNDSQFIQKIDEHIERILNDPQLIKKISARPFIVFDKGGDITVHNGAMQYLDRPPEVKFVENKATLEEYFEIIITSKECLEYAPIIEMLGGMAMYPQKPVRGPDKGRQWIYKFFLQSVYSASSGGDDSYLLFRLEIIPNR